MTNAGPHAPDLTAATVRDGWCFSAQRRWVRAAVQSTRSKEVLENKGNAGYGSGERVPTACPPQRLLRPPLSLHAKCLLSKSLSISQGIGLRLSAGEEVNRQLGGQLVRTPIQVQYPIG